MALPAKKAHLEVVHADPFHDGRSIVRVGLIVIAIAFGGVGLWATFAPLEGAVIVPSVVKVDFNRKTVQHLEGGIVKQILVQPGSRVAKGQPLIVLEDVAASATVEALRFQLDGELARTARLQAERARVERVTFPPALVARAATEPRVDANVKAELQFFAARRKLLEDQVALLRKELTQVEEQIASLHEQVKAADVGLDILVQQLRMGESLHKQNFIAETRLLDQKRALAEKQEKRGEYMSDLSSARQRISEIELRVISLYNTYVKEASDELKDSQKKIAELEERLRPTEDALRRQTIVAPLAGEVVDLRAFTVGGVIAPRAPLMDIVPLDTALVIEGKVKVGDVSHVRVGGEAAVQLSAFKQRTTPRVPGKVIYVSVDRLTENDAATGEPYYLVHVEVDKPSLQALKDVYLAPGMPAEVFITTRKRTVLDYLLEPVVDTLRKSMRES
jgi:membrane fusion protein, epimerase transport system